MNHAPKCRVLVVDDDEVHLRLTARALRGHGFDATEASDVRAALQEARAFPPDVILSDVQMPGDSGLDFVAAIRADPETATLPVVLMTGDAHFAGLRQGMENGADDYLPKPFTLAQLVGAVDARLARQRALARQAEVLRSQHAAHLPHELRTPLAAILSLAELLGDEQIEPAAAAEYGRLIRSAAERLQRCTERLLAETLPLSGSGYAGALGAVKRD